MSFNNRITKVKEILYENNLDGIYITNLTNVRYLTGFTGSAGSLLILDNESHFFTDGRYISQSKDQVKNCTIHIVGGAHFIAIQTKKLLPHDIKIGFESTAMTVSSFDQLQTALKHCHWIKTSMIVEKIAAIKDDFEIDSLKTAIEITDTVFTKIIPELKEGAIEKEISAKISYLFKMNGAEGDSYESIIGSGWLGALPHARPTDKNFKKEIL